MQSLPRRRLPVPPSFAQRARRTCPFLKRHFTVLAIESSADDTGVAVVTSSREVLANVVTKQHSIHEKFGGIQPYEAAQAHRRNLPGTMQEALRRAQLTMNDVDGIAFTRGPGMTGCLAIGASAAQTLAAALNKPLIGVHHMQAHALTPLLTSPEDELPVFPFLTLLVSGGHTLLLLATSLTNFRILATTLDESIGRAIDKVSRLLCLSWTALGPGAALEEFCQSNPNSTASEAGAISDEFPALPIVMPRTLCFSFSGIHSNVQRFVAARGGGAALNETTKRAIAREFQRAAIGQLEAKLQLAVKWCSMRGIHVRHVVVSGGVASNSYLRERLRLCLRNEDPEEAISLVYPPPSLCTDNAAMIAWASMHRFLAGESDEYSIDIRSKWSIEDLARPSSDSQYTGHSSALTDAFVSSS